MDDSQPSPSSNLDDAGNSTTNIPLDLTIEILARLPGNSIIRFQYVSKLWFSIIRSKDFTDSFLTRSKTRPRLLFTFKHFDSRKRFIFSAPEHDNNDKYSTVVARHDMTISNLVYYIRSRPVNGFVCCTRGSSIAVCNPTTRQIVKLPDVESNGRHVYARLGYDPVEDQYKVLCVMFFDPYSAKCKRQGIQPEPYVFTLQSQQKEWRKIEITQGVAYRSVDGGICIDGAIYFGDGRSRIVRFDVRSETLELIQAPENSLITETSDSALVNYNGKLGGVDYNYTRETKLWILEDAEKQEWSELRFARPSEWDDLLEDYFTSEGESHTGELIMVDSRLISSEPFSVCYYDFHRESLRRVEVQGIADDEFRRVHGIGKRTREILGFPGYVENIRFL
ncbi:unnamed protein product [Arabidopsis halleri]